MFVKRIVSAKFNRYMQSQRRKKSGQQATSFRSKIVFVIKVLLVLLIGYSLARYATFYQEYTILYNLAYGLNTFLTGSVFVSVGRFLLISWYGRRKRGSERIRGNVILGINQFAGVLNAVFAVLGIMLAFGVNPRDFLTSITLVAMAIALLFRDYITNMISGLLIMFSDRFTIGDYIRIGEYQGRIIEISLSNIVIRNEDDDMVLIPNNTVFTLNIVNQTLENKRKMVVDFCLPLDRSHDKDGLEKRLRDTIASMNEEILADSVQFRVVSVNSTEVHYKLSFLLHTQAKVRKSMIRDRLLKELLSFDAGTLRTRSSEASLR